MTALHLLNRLGTLLLCLGLGTAHADKLDDNLQTVWESLWDQRGTPRPLLRWDKTIRYRIHGADASRHREHIERALKAATDIARIELVDVSGQANAETAATLDIEVVKDTDLQDHEPCFTQHLKWSNWAYDKARVKMRSRDAWRCTFHEIMHVMGIPGHPSGKTVLSYFPYRRDMLMDLDRLMLAAWYSPAMPKNATPLEALAVLSEAVAGQTDLDLPAEEASSRAKAFNQRMLRQMEAIATGQGEVPDIVLRSGKASQESINKMQPSAAFFVGMAYLRGGIVSVDLAASAAWFKRAAQKGYLPAQIMWSTALTTGTGVEADRLAGHAWLTLAAKTGSPAVINMLARLEKSLSSEEFEKARSQPAPSLDPP
ncbi:MAG TPA: hypothetical protein VGJ72_06705 [Polaromonas sp.]